MSQKLFNDPKSLFEKKMDEYFVPQPDTAGDLFMKALSLVLYDGENRDLLTLYQLLPLDLFVRVINAFNGRSIKFVTREELQDSITFALCYYYREIEGLSWEEVQRNFDHEIASVGYGIRIGKLNKSMREKLHQYLQRMRDKNEHRQTRVRTT